MIEVFRQFIISLKERGLEAFGRYYSEYPAFVADRDDPEFRQRLRLVIPMLTRDAPMKYWALPSTYSGATYGMQVLPKRGDLVWVTFQNGDRRYPKWHHGYPGKDENLGSTFDNYDNYWFKTPEGLSLEFRGETKECYLSVPGSNNNTLQLVIDSYGVSLVRDNEKISLGQLQGSAQPAVLGTSNESALNELASKVDAIYTALSTSPTLANDGGAVYKAAIIASLTSAQFPISPAFQTTAQNTKSQHVTLD
jgi:hypothetical protein